MYVAMVDKKPTHTSSKSRSIHRIRTAILEYEFHNSNHINTFVFGADVHTEEMAIQVTSLESYSLLKFPYRPKK